MNRNFFSSTEYYLLGGVIILTLVFAENVFVSAEAEIKFDEVTDFAGISYTGFSWGSAWGDLNGDGWSDLWMANHGRIPSLYVNNGNGTFTNVVNKLNLEFLRNNDSHGASWVDFDNDGDQDLFLLTGAGRGQGNGSNILFVNQDGTLQDKASFYGLDYPLGRGRTPLWFDYDNDGRLDVMIGNDLRKDGKAPPGLFHQTEKGFQDVTNSSGFEFTKSVGTIQISDLSGDGKMDLLFLHTKPQGVYDLSSFPFENIIDSLEIPNLWTVDFEVEDFNGDLLPDIFLTRMAKYKSVVIEDNNIIKSHFYITDDEHGFSFSSTGEITFQVYSHVPPDTPVYLGTNGILQNKKKFTINSDDPSTWGMPNKSSDEVGIYIGYEPSEQIWRVFQFTIGHSYSNILVEPQNEISDLHYLHNDPKDKLKNDILLIYKGNGFEDKTFAAGFENPNACRSVGTGDFDNDMDVDIYLVCSLDVKNLENKLYENLGNNSFNSVKDFGAKGSSLGVGEAVSVVDYDNDGFLDLFVTNGLDQRPYSADGPVQLFRNLGNNNNWIEIDLIGTVSNKDGIGSRILITAGNKTQLREQDGGMHFASQNHQRIHYGLGNNTDVEKIIVYWPNGIVNKIENVVANQILQIIEPKNPIPPMQQISLGLEKSEVICRDGLELIMKSNTHKVACVKPTSKISLTERGWAVAINN